MTPSSTRYGGWFPAWTGLAVGLCLIIPTLLKIDTEGWTDANAFFVVAGILLAALCALRLALVVADALEKRRRD